MKKKEEKKKIVTWKEKHTILEKKKNNPKNTWLQLWVAKNDITDEKVLRLMKPFNYFSIPNQDVFNRVLSLLNYGANKNGWLVHEKINFTKGSNINITKEEREILSEVDKSGVDKGSIKKLLKELKGADVIDITKTTELLKEITLSDMNNFSDQIKNRLEKIDLFKKISMDNKTYEIRGENSIHRFLEKNMWILDERYWLMHSNETLRKIIGEEVSRDPKKRPDLVCGTVGNKMILIELKRPKHKLSIEDLNQVENYLSIIEKHSDTKYSFEAYIVGKEISDELKDKIKYRATNIFKIKTFSDFIDDVEKRYKEFRK